MNIQGVGNKSKPTPLGEAQTENRTLYESPTRRLMTPVLHIWGLSPIEVLLNYLCISNQLPLNHLAQLESRTLINHFVHTEIFAPKEIPLCQFVKPSATMPKTKTIMVNDNVNM